MSKLIGTSRRFKPRRDYTYPELRTPDTPHRRVRLVPRPSRAVYERGRASGV